MISATLLAIFGSFDIYYFVKLIKKYNKVSKMISLLNNEEKYLDVSQAIEFMQSNNVPLQFPVIVKGFLKSQTSNRDKNILSFLTSIPIMKSDILAQYIYKRIPYTKVVQNSFHTRPQSLQNVSFIVQDTKGSSISIENLEKSNFSGALTQVVENIQYYQRETQSKFLRFLKQTFNRIFFASPSKFKEEQIGQKIAYYGILNEQFSYIVGNLQKGKDNKFYIRKPKFVTKQISFIVNKLKKYKKILMIGLALFTAIQIVLLYYFAKYLKAKIGLKMKIFTDEDDEINDDVSVEQTCIICFSAARSVVLKPCRHYGLCYNCYKHISKQKVCPICKENIQGIIRILINKTKRLKELNI